MWWNSSWAISNPERWCCESATLNMPANLENSVVTTGLEKVSFHFNPKESQCQRILKVLHNCINLTLISFQSNAQNSPSQVSTVCGPWTFRCQAGFRRQRSQRSNCQHPLNHRKAREFQKNIYFCFIDYPKPLTVWTTTNCGKFWKRWEYQTTWPASWEICI